MAHDILLETGTNEVEFLEFYLDDQSFGINVAKVKQLIRFERERLTRLPDTHGSVMGTFLHQDQNIPIVDLSLHLKRGAAREHDKQIIIITDFNNAVTGFLVDGVNKIHRITWNHLQPVSSALEMHNPRITGCVLIDENEVMVLDFEYILDDIQPDNALHHMENPLEETAPSSERTRDQVSVFFADDSKLFRDCMIENLKQAGYTKLTVFENGRDLHQAILQVNARANAEGGRLTDQVQLVLTDIEMPQMDGLTLCKNLKEMAPNLPVIILSSLITEQMALKCDRVGADANLSKKSLDRLLSTMDLYS
ncbi:MAG: chemotaxis protein [Acidobacteriota bacterium]|nr:chemotaxis protein [Acidobacteriota bacterium]